MAVGRYPATAKLVRDLRKATGLSQRKFARSVGIALSTLTKLEAGAADPMYSTIARMRATVDAMPSPEPKSIEPTSKKEVPPP